jgi:hypothetical protein
LPKERLGEVFLHISCPKRRFGPIKVLEILKNFFQEVFKRGTGQSPVVSSYRSLPSAMPFRMSLSKSSIAERI